jgi:hypothetical protein
MFPECVSREGRVCRTRIISDGVRETLCDVDKCICSSALMTHRFVIGPSHTPRIIYRIHKHESGVVVVSWLVLEQKHRQLERDV